jgi:beta-glucanase (GH16 family)
MKPPSFVPPLLSVLAAAVVLVGCDIIVDDSLPAVSPPENFIMTFEDEFEGAAGSPPDLAIWQFDLGTGPDGDGWGNQEQQFYTGDPENIGLDGNGNLVITAVQEEFGGRQYTSSRIRTQDNFEQQYGRFEARIQIPSGEGLWPAFWMLGNTFPDSESTPEEIRRGTWPAPGEIDIMEADGFNTDRIFGSVHGPGYSGGEALTEVFRSDVDLSEDFHVYAIEWDPGVIRWYVDDELYATVTTAAVRNQVPLPGASDPEWVFTKPFFMILNLAVGGSFVGDVVDDTALPASMVIDYVRVYERNPASLPSAD